MNDDEFLDHVADVLAELPDVDAIALGGSRAHGTATPDSDWDLGLYYRDHFDPQALREVGWDGEVSELGGGAAVSSMAASQYAHAVLASRRAWTTNEKRLLSAAGLDTIDALVAESTDDPSSLAHTIGRARELAHGALDEASR